MIKTLKMTGLNSVREHHNTTTRQHGLLHRRTLTCKVLQSTTLTNSPNLPHQSLAYQLFIQGEMQRQPHDADDAGGLDSVIFLARGAAVMLTCNLWQEVGCAMVPPVLFKISSSILIASPLACPLQHLYSSHIIQAPPFCKQAVILSPFHHTYLNRKVVDSDCLDSNCHFGYDMQ